MEVDDIRNLLLHARPLDRPHEPDRRFDAEPRELAEHRIDQRMVCRRPREVTFSFRDRAARVAQPAQQLADLGFDAADPSTRV
jgi:hypothetical protein